MVTRRGSSNAGSPQAVLVFPDRALRLLWEHAFATAGWRAHCADTAMDALAVAFNCDADAVVTVLVQTPGAESGLAVLGEFAADQELSSVLRYLLVPEGISRSLTVIHGATVFEQPCDPFWLISDIDTRLGRRTPAGLGHRPFSDGDLDVAIHHWWWSLAAADLVRQAVRMRAESGDENALVAAMGGRLGRRIDAEVRFVPGVSPRPEGVDLSLWGMEGSGAEALVVQLTAASGPIGWWRIAPPEEGLTARHIECIGALAAVLTIRAA